MLHQARIRLPLVWFGGASGWHWLSGILYLSIGCSEEKCGPEKVQCISVKSLTTKDTKDTQKGTKKNNRGFSADFAGGYYKKQLVDTCFQCPPIVCTNKFTACLLYREVAYLERP